MLFRAILIGAALLAPSTAFAVGGAGSRSSVSAGMAAIPAGTHQRLYGDSRTSMVRIQRFALDRDPVTRGQFDRFANTNRKWSLGASTSADAANQPVTGITWYAANAYCEAQGKRLPTSDEWEYAAAASETSRDATHDQRFLSRLLALYGARSANARKPVATGFRNVYGVRGMHDRVWEWTSDARPETGAAHDHSAMKGHKHDMFCASSAIGAANPSNYPAFMRYAVRAGLDRRSSMQTLGFRCAATLS